MSRLKFRIVAILFILLFTIGYSQTIIDNKDELFKKGRLIKVPADTGVSEKLLGLTYDKDFKQTNVNLFEKSENNLVEEVQYNSEILVIDNQTSLSANANFLGLVKTGIGYSNNQRYAILSIYNITKTVTFNPIGETKEESDLFIKRIYYGWSMNYIISGTSSKFSVDAKIAMSSIISSLSDVGLDYKLGEYNLEKKLKLIGLRNKTENPPLVFEPSSVAEYFQVSEKQVPIFVEYEVARDFITEPIKFESSRITAGKYKIRFVSLEISKLKPSLNTAWDVLGGLPDPYIKVFINGKEIVTSDKIQDTVTPMFNINKTIHLKEGDRIQIKAFDADVIEHDYIGEAFINYEELTKRKINTEIDLQTLDGSGLNSAKMELSPVQE
jgi:hypothetical protein